MITALFARPDGQIRFFLSEIPFRGPLPAFPEESTPLAQIFFSHVGTEVCFVTFFFFFLLVILLSFARNLDDLVEIFLIHTLEFR